MKPIKWIKNKFTLLFGEAHSGQNPLTIPLDKMTDKEVAKGIYTLHNSFRLAYVDELRKVADDLQNSRINQQEADRRTRTLNTNTIKNTEDYLVFEAHRRANRNSAIVTTGIAVLSVLISLVSYFQSKNSSETADRVSSKALELATEQHKILDKNFELESKWREEQLRVLAEISKELSRVRRNTKKETAK